MPFFRSTYNILTKYDEDEYYESKHFDSDNLVLPSKGNWDYKREITIEDVDIWEILHESSGGVGVYVAWSPYAEFYMLTKGNDERNPARYVNSIPYYHRLIETFYGPGAQNDLISRIKELNLPISLPVHKVWVEPEDMWLYSKETDHIDKKIISLK